MVEPFAVLPDTTLHGVGLSLGLAPVVAADRSFPQPFPRIAVTVERLIERLRCHPSPGETLSPRVQSASPAQAKHPRPCPEQALPNIAARGQDVLATPA